MPVSRYKRCHFYNDKGRSRYRRSGSRGCPRRRGDCNFIHPDQPEWDEADSVPPPSKFIASDTPPHSHSPSPHRDKDYDRRDYPDRRRSDPYRTGESRKRPRSPAHSSTSADHSERPRALSHHSGDPSDSRSDMNVKGNGISGSPSWLPIPSLSSRIGPILQKPSPPPPAPRAAPPPLPRDPSFLSDTSRSRAESFSKPPPIAEDPNPIWDERVRVFAACVTASKDVEKIGAEIKHIRRLMESSHFHNLSDERKNSMQTDLAKLEVEKKERYDDYERNKAAMAKMNFWPVLQAPDVQAVAARDAEIKANIKELRDALAVVNDSVISVLRRESSASTLVADPTTVTEPSVIPPPRPRKRQRLSDDSPRSSGTPDPHNLSETLESVQDRLSGLDQRLSDMENNFVQQEAELRLEIEHRIQTRIEDVAAGTLVQPPAVLEEVEKKVNTTGGQIHELAVEVASLVTNNATVRSDVEKLLQAEEDRRRKVDETDKKIDNYRNILSAQAQQMTLLGTSMESARAKYLCQMQTPILSVEHLTHEIEDSIRDEVRAAMQPTVAELRAQVVDMVRAKNQDLFNALMPKVASALQMMNMMSVEFRDKVVPPP